MWLILITFHSLLHYHVLFCIKLLYMGCSDVSEFEHIYGRILTTSSCVYGRLFTWTNMVDFNALIVWKTFIDICFSVKASLWVLTAAYTKFWRMIWSMIWSCGHRSRPPMCTFTSSKRRETSLGKSWKHTTLWFPGGQAISGAEVQFCDATSLFSFPNLPSDFCPSPFLTRVWGYHDGKIVELKIFVGTF